MNRGWKKIVAFLGGMGIGAMGAETAASSSDPEVMVSGFLDTFYVHDFNDPRSDRRQPFLYNHNRHSEADVNLALVKVGIDHQDYRASLGLQGGTYMIDNYANEKGFAKRIYEAYAGIPLNDQKDLWIDVGVFPSFIGFESAVSTDNWTLTRSLCAENSPYFFTGAKITYTPDEKWLLMGTVLNGWQRIDAVEGNSLPSFGTQVFYKYSDAVSLNWSTFIGTDQNDANRKMRYFNNLYGTFQLSERLGLIAGLDVGWEQREKNSSNYDSWFVPTLITRYTFSPEWAAAFRAEYYQDSHGIIVAQTHPKGFRTVGMSLNLDHTPHPSLSIRGETRWFRSPDPIFEDGIEQKRDNVFIGLSLALKFSKLL